MWLQESYALFGVATERYAKRRQDLSQVEEELTQARHEWRVDSKVFKIIENSDAWDYPKWWPRVSDRFEQSIALPTHICSRQGKRQAVEHLHAAIKNIEIASVVLRFMCPEEFAIFSSPVTSFLCLHLTPKPVESYLHYLRILKGFVDHYKTLERVADVDMALWAAAHLSPEPRYTSLLEQMRADEFLWQVRLKNLTKGLGGFWRKGQRERLLFASALIDHDFVLASVIAARVYESDLRALNQRCALISNDSQEMNLDLVRRLERSPQVASSGLRPGLLEILWKLRNKAVHGQADFTQKQAELFLQGVEEVWQAFHKPSAGAKSP